jgi:hypothetical protein
MEKLHIRRQIHSSHLEQFGQTEIPRPLPLVLEAGDGLQGAEAFG